MIVYLVDTIYFYMQSKWINEIVEKIRDGKKTVFSLILRLLNAWISYLFCARLQLE